MLRKGVLHILIYKLKSMSFKNYNPIDFILFYLLIFLVNSDFKGLAARLLLMDQRFKLALCAYIYLIAITSIFYKNWH